MLDVPGAGVRRKRTRLRGPSIVYHGPIRNNERTGGMRTHLLVAAATLTWRGQARPHHGGARKPPIRDAPDGGFATWRVQEARADALRKRRWAFDARLAMPEETSQWVWVGKRDARMWTFSRTAATRKALAKNRDQRPGQSSCGLDCPIFCAPSVGRRRLYRFFLSLSLPSPLCIFLFLSPSSTQSPRFPRCSRSSRPPSPAPLPGSRADALALTRFN